MDRQFVGQVPALGDPDRVDLADEVGDGGVGRGQLLAVAVAAVDPGDRQVLARLGQEVLGEAGDRVEGVVVDLGVGDHGQPLVEQAHHGSDDPRLGLAAWPNRMMSWPARTAFSSWGRTVSSKPSTPVTSGRGGNPGRCVATDLVGHADRDPTGLAQGTQCRDVGRRRRRVAMRRGRWQRAGVRAPGWSWPEPRVPVPTWCVDTTGPGTGRPGCHRHPEVVVSHGRPRGGIITVCQHTGPGPARWGAVGPPTKDGYGRVRRPGTAS